MIIGSAATAPLDARIKSKKGIASKVWAVAAIRHKPQEFTMREWQYTEGGVKAARSQEYAYRMEDYHF